MSQQEETLDPIDDVELEPIEPTPRVRTLQEPPDIWDMVHETHTDFKPGSAFAGRITSNPLWLVALLLVIAGGAGFWFMMSRRAVGSKPASPTVQAESRNVNPGLSSRSAPANPASSSTGQEQVNTPPSVPSNANSGASASQSAPENSTMSSPKVQPANSPAHPDTGQSAIANLKTSGAALRTRTEANAGRQKPTSGGMFTDSSSTGKDLQDGIKPSTSNTARGEVVSLSGNKDGTQTSTQSDAKTDSPATTKKAIDKNASPQLIAPSRANPTPRAKVIPWP